MPNQKRTIDERLDALAQSVELLALMQKESEHRIEVLATISEANERRFERIGKAIRAGLEEWFDEDSNGSGEGG